MKKQMILLILLCILTVVIIFYLQKNEQKTPSLEAPSIDLGSESLLKEAKEKPLYYRVIEDNWNPATKYNIIGTWRAVSEQVGMSKSVNNDLDDSSIIFYEEGVFLSESYGISESGIYRIKDGQIIFYGSEEETRLQGNFLQANGYVKNNQLILIYPQFPKTVMYEKIN